MGVSDDRGFPDNKPGQTNEDDAQSVEGVAGGPGPRVGSAVDIDDVLDPSERVRHGALALRRQRCPVAPFGDRWFVASNDAVRDGFTRSDVFGGSGGAVHEPDDPDDQIVSAMPEPRHGKVRRVVNSVVAFHKSQHIGGFLQRRCEELLDGLRAQAEAAGEAGVDVMALYAEWIPPEAIAALLGVDPADAGAYYSWADELAEAFGRAGAEGFEVTLAQASPTMAAYVDRIIDERLATPAHTWPHDALTRFLTTEVEGERLSRRAIRTQIMFIIGAGSETTRNLLGNLLHRLALDPDTYALLRSDRSLVNAAVEESLRIDPPAQTMIRRCEATTLLGDREIAKGETVMLSIASANRDEKMFVDSSRFSITRLDFRSHVAFGAGSHVCPGAMLARLEARTALNVFLDRVRTVRLAPGFLVTEVPRKGILFGPASLPLVLDFEDAVVGQSSGDR